MPRIDLSAVFGGEVPEGVDAEKTGAALETQIESLLEAERSGVRSSVDLQLKEQNDKIELLTAELEEAKSGKSGTPAAPSTSATEPGGKAAEIRARQQKEAQEADIQKRIEEAVGNTKDYFTAVQDAVKAGIPDEVVELAEGSGKELRRLTVMYQTLGKSNGETKKPGNDNVNPGGQNPSGAGDGKETSWDRVGKLVGKMPTVTMSGGMAHDLSS